MQTEPQRYTSVAIGLHWAIAVLLIGNILLGWSMHDADGRPIEALWQLHKSIGITVLILTLARLGWRFVNPPPPLPSDMPKIEKLGSHAVHIAFYALMLGIPLGGWVLVSVSHFSVPTVLFGVISWPHLPVLPDLPLETREALYYPIKNAHGFLAWGVFGLLVLHVLGALKHEFGNEEGVLKKMIPSSLFGQTSAPSPARGAIGVFGGALVFFIAIAAIPPVSRALDNPSSGTALPPSEAVSGTWNIDTTRSFIRFSGAHDGNSFEGQFETWSADIIFDENDLASSEVAVRVQTGSARTGDKLYDDSLRAGEWFNVTAFSTAIVSLDNFRVEGSNFVADATVTIKDVEVTVPFEFSLSKEDGVTTMTGTTELARSPLNLGQDSDPGADWVSETVDIDVTVVASPPDAG